MKRLASFLALFLIATPAWAIEPGYKAIPALGWSLDRVVDLTNAGTVTGFTVAITNLNCSTYNGGGTVTTDAGGNFICDDDQGSGSGDITDVNEGFAIDVTGSTGPTPSVAFDNTEFAGSQTWGDASTDTIVWTWNRATGTDPTLTFGSGTVTGQTVAMTSLICTGTQKLSSDAGGNFYCLADDTAPTGNAGGDLTGTYPNPTVAANAVALTTDTTGNYIATLADAGNSTITVVNGSAEGGAATVDAVDLNCTNCIGPTEITDLTLGTDTAGNYTASVAEGTAIDVTGAVGEGQAASVAFDSTEVEATTWGAGGNASNVWTYNLSGTDPTLTAVSGGLTLVGTLTADAVTLGADENLTVGSDTLTFSSGTSDFELSDDLNITDAAPHLQLIDNTASQDDFEWWVNQSVVGLANVTDSQQLMHFASNNDFFLDTYNCSALTNGGKLTTDGNGRVVCQDDTGAAASGDITSVGDVTSGAAFDGTQGTTLTFNDADGDQTIAYDTSNNDFAISDDLTITDATPHLSLVDSTAGQTDYELTVDGSNLFITNTSNNIIVAQLNDGNRSHTTTPNAIIDRPVSGFCAGVLSTAMNCEEARIYIPQNCTPQRVELAATTAPTTQAIIVDVNECTAPGTCTTLFSTQSNRPMIPAGGTNGSTVVFNDTVIAAGNYLGLDLDQVGSGTAGSNLTMTLVCRY